MSEETTIEKGVKENGLSKPPQNITIAIGEVQKKITKIPCNARNEFAKYNYVSIDGYYEYILPLLNEFGLTILPTEKSAQLSNDGKTYKGVFDFYVIKTDTGDIWGPITRTVYNNFTGVQAIGAALSYAEKFFLRTLFKIPSDEPEDPSTIVPDSNPENDADSSKPVTKGQEPKKQANQKPNQKTGKNAKPANQQHTPEVSWEYSGQPYRIFDVNDGAKYSSHSTLKSWGTALRASAKASKPDRKAKILAANQREISRIVAEIPDYSELSADEQHNMMVAVNQVVVELGGEPLLSGDDAKPVKISKTEPKSLAEQVADGEAKNLGG